jgi:hypothetical protein
VTVEWTKRVKTLFYECHGVRANVSKTKPAKLLAVFVVDANEMELTIPFGNCGLIPFVRRYCRG